MDSAELNLSKVVRRKLYTQIRVDFTEVLGKMTEDIVRKSLED